MRERFNAINHEYLKYLKDDSTLSVSDLKEIFGFKNNGGVHTLIKRCHIPKATHHLGNDGRLKQKRSTTSKLYWLKNEIMPYIIEMMEEEKSNEKT